MKPTIQDLMVSLIERTGNPLAPIVLNECYNALHSLSKTLVPIADQNKTKEIQTKLMDALPNIEQECASAEFSLALAIMLAKALEYFGANK